MCECHLLTYLLTYFNNSFNLSSICCWYLYHWTPWVLRMKRLAIRGSKYFVTKYKSTRISAGDLCSKHCASRVWPNTQIHVALRQRGRSWRTHGLSHAFDFLVDLFSSWFYTCNSAQPVSVDGFQRSMRHVTFFRAMCLLGIAIKRLPLSCARRCMGQSNSQFMGC